MIFIAVLLIIAIGLLYWMYKEAHKNRVIRKDIILDTLPSSFTGMRVFFISDIHFRIIDEEIIKQIEGNTDIIIIGGDIMEKGVPFANVEKNIKMLKKVAPTYFVWGNNDYEGDYRQLDAYLLENGVKALDNTSVHFELEKDKIALVGVDDVGHHKDNLALALADAGNCFKILASHDPKIIEKLEDQDGIGLVLCGHTHGGQIRLFGIGIREKGCLKKVGNKMVLISNGYGTTRIPLRLGAPAQTHLLTLITAKDN